MTQSYALALSLEKEVEQADLSLALRSIGLTLSYYRIQQNNLMLAHNSCLNLRR